MEKIYVLQCNHGKYYVGKTSNIDRRFAEHLSGHGGSEWTRCYGAQQIIEVENMNSSFDETKKTLEYMKRFGIDNVRGAQWSNVQLTAEQRTEILKMINPDGCFHCGEIGHFANNCNRRNQNYSHFFNACNTRVIFCERCGRDNHSEKDCYATFGIDGDMLDCARCGRDSHSADQCFARTDIDGNKLY